MKFPHFVEQELFFFIPVFAWDSETDEPSSHPKILFVLDPF